MLQEMEKTRSDPKWTLLSSCYKKAATKIPGQQPMDNSAYKQELDEFRQQKFAEAGIDSEAYDELVALRVANEQNINHLENQVAEVGLTNKKIELCLKLIEINFLGEKSYRSY